MAFLQKTWKDRVAEYINRRVLTKEDGTTELVSVERSEGTISQEGDAFSAANMNDLEQRIANEFSEQNKKMSDGLRGYTNPIVIASKNDLTPMEQNGAYLLADSEEGREVLNQHSSYVTTTTVEGNFYRMAGADSVFPFKKLPLNAEVVAKYWTADSTTYSVTKEGIYIAYQGYDPGSRRMSVNSANTATILLDQQIYVNDASAADMIVFHGKVGDVIAINWGQILYGQSITRISY